MRSNNQNVRLKKALRIALELERMYPKAEISLDYSSVWELFVAVVLSAQCTDKKVNEVTQNLFSKYPTIDDYVSAHPKKFEDDIRPTGFYRSKAKTILKSAIQIKQNFGGQVPQKMEQLLSLPGIGRKSANIILTKGFNIVEGIPVDTHIRRLSRLLGLTDNTNADKIENDLMRILPKKQWALFPYRLTLYGKQVCKAKAHDHSKCALSNIGSEP